jgi:cytochrome c peroxidase
MPVMRARFRPAGAGVCVIVSVAMMAGPGKITSRPGRPIVMAPSQGNVARHTGDSVPAAQRVFESQLDALLASFDTLARRVEMGQPAGAQSAFRRARTAYKRAEGMLGYYAPDAIIALEGPLEAEGEDDILPRPYNTPGAFPMIESLIFPRLADSARKTALARIHAMRERVGVLRSSTDVLDVEDVAIFDAARAELARVSTLDIAGFDSDRQDDALLDAAAALDGVRATLVSPDGGENESAAAARRRADSSLRLAASYLRRHRDFERMDRFAFLARYSLPASHAVAALRAARGVANTRGIHLWREDAASVYDSSAFDPLAYAARYADTPSMGGRMGERVVALGARLFADPRLSGPGTRSCATCHLPGRAFTDGLPKRASLAPPVPAVGGPLPPARHTPTLLNAALQPALFDDERARAPEQQIAQVLSNAEEMGSSTDTAVRRVAADTGYRAAFASVFGGSPDRAVTGLTLRIALASYVRSLIALNAPFDRAVRGDSAAMSVAARRGFTVFMGKGRCGTCHFAPLFNGTEPPAYVTTDPEIIGVPEQPVLRDARLDPDPGRAAIDRVPSHRFAFKVPTVRNAAVTGPYMHNGAYRTLDDVVAFYNAGGGSGVGLDLPYQTLFDHPLDLTRGERADLIAFLRSLTDTYVGATAPSRVASR